MKHSLNPALRKQKGFNLVMAIFILVVLALLGIYMARTSGVQHAIVNDALGGARVFQAAKAGLGWSAARINAGGTCATINAQASLSFPDIAGVTVALSCTSSSYQEGGNTINVYLINAQGQYSVYGSPDYVSRRLEMTMVR